MFRRGFVSYDRLPDSVPHGALLPAFAFTLLGDMPATFSSRDEAVFEAIYDEIRAGPHFKRTYGGRYERIDAMLAEIVAGFPARDDPIRVHDMAASNAITSVDLHHSLNRVRETAVYASDYYDGLYVATLRNGWQVVFNALSEPLQFVGFGLVVSALAIERKRYWLNRTLRRLLRPILLKQAERLLADHRAGRAAPVRRIELTHPVARALAASDPRFTLGRDDLFDPAPGAYDVVRIMSALDDHPHDKLRDGIRRVGTTVVEGGILVIGRNRGRHAAEMPTSFFAKRGAALLPLRDIDGGFELKHLVD